MNIAYIISTLRRCGPTNQLFYILKYLNRDVFTPFIITISNEGNDSMMEEFLSLNIPIIQLKLSRVKGILQSVDKISSILKRNNIDLIHSTGIRADVVISRYFHSYKKITSVRNYPLDDYPAKFGRVKGHLMAFSHLKALSKISWPIVCSKTLKLKYEVKEGIKLNVVRNGVDTQKYFPIQEDEKILLRRKLGIDENKTIFVTTGSLIKRKNPFDIVHAFLRSNISQSSCLYFLGDGPLKSQLIKDAKECDTIIFKGNVDNVHEYLKVCDYFISASGAEGLPNAVMEAMACGIPVILSDIPSHKEIDDIVPGGIIFFPVGDINTLTKNIDDTSSFDRNKLSDIVLSIISNELNAKKMSEDYQKNYIQLVNGLSK